MRFVALFAVVISLAACRTSTVPPVVGDPRPSDASYPPSSVELHMVSHGGRLNALLYQARSAGPHPTVILLHGFPGNERNQDVAQAIRRAGANVFLFQYRGAWGSGGVFSFANAQDDVTAALTFLREPANATRLRIDPTRIALIGHSMGGWLALRAAASDDRVSCVAGLEFWDAGFDGTTLPHDQKARAEFVAYAAEVSGMGGPLRTADGGEGLVRSLEVNGANWMLAPSAPALKDKAVLLLDNMVNPYHEPFVAELRRLNASRLTEKRWDTDHSFSGLRLELADEVVRWLREDCAYGENS